MYIPASFRQDDPNALEALIRENAFGTLVSSSRGKIAITHIPFLCDLQGKVLLGHVARANPHWRELADASDVVVVFQGPHAYVSPTWYAKGGVPTWNYTAVHVHGKATVFDEPERLRALVDGLATTYESARKDPWSGEYPPTMLRAIVGMEIQIDRIEGQFKLSQNKSAQDRRTVSERLCAAADSVERATGQMVANPDQAPTPDAT